MFFDNIRSVAYSREGYSVMPRSDHFITYHVWQEVSWHYWHSQGILRAFSGHSQGILRAFSGHCHGILRAFSGHSQGILRAFSGHSHGILRAFSRHSQGILKAFSGHSQGIIMALSWHSQGILRSFSWHSQGILRALSWHSQGILKAILRALSGHSQGILRAFSGHSQGCMVGQSLDFWIRRIPRFLVLNPSNKVKILTQIISLFPDFPAFTTQGSRENLNLPPIQTIQPRIPHPEDCEDMMIYIQFI